MKVKFRLLRRQIAYDLRNGITLQYKKLLFFMLIVVFLFLLFNRKVSGYASISEDSVVGFWDYLIYLFRGKEKVGSLSSLDIFDIPIEWMLIHSYFLFAIGTYPKEEYEERGYQFLLRVGSKWYWWISKGVYIIVAILIYYISIVVIAFGFTTIKGASLYDVNHEICYYIARIDVSKLTKSNMIWGTCITPLIIFITLCMAEMYISFLTSSMVSVIVMLAYLSASAYWCKEWLLGNYTMLLRGNDLSLVAGIIISCGSIVIFFVFGYFHFKQLDVIGKQKGEIL